MKIWNNTDYAFDLLEQFGPETINHMSMVNAALRPSGKSYRDRLIAGEFNSNPSAEIDDLLKDNNGFLIFQEDTIKFLSDICGFSGSHADNVRRAIGKKDLEALKKELPQILEGYCDKSPKAREIAEQEAKEFIQIISDSSEYQFGFNHSTGYSMNGYMAARLRYYYPLEFTTAYLNRAENEEDIKNGTVLAKHKGFAINPPKFRYSKAKYMPEKSTNSIYKGLESIKYLNEKVAEELYDLRDNQYETFVDLLHDIKNKTSANARQIRILIGLNFFSEFGKNQKLLTIFEAYEKRCKKTLKEETKVKRLVELRELEANTQDKSVNIKEQIQMELEYMGYETTIIPKMPDNVYIVTEMDMKYTPKLRMYRLNNGEVVTMKCKKNDLKLNPFGNGSVIRVKSYTNRNKSKKINGEWKTTDEVEMYLTDWNIVL